MSIFEFVTETYFLFVYSIKRNLFVKILNMKLFRIMLKTEFCRIVLCSFSILTKNRNDDSTFLKFKLDERRGGGAVWMTSRSL